MSRLLIGRRIRHPPIGRPIWNTRVYVLDGGLEPVPAGVVGRALHCGLWCLRGAIWGGAGLTAERFVADPYGVAGEPDVPDRGPGAVAFGRRAGVPGPRGRADEAARVPDRAWRDRGCAAGAGRRVRRRRWLRARTRAGSGGVWSATWLRRRVRRCDAAALRGGAGRGGCRTTWCRLRSWCWMRLPLTPNGKLDRRALPAPELAPARSAAGAADAAGGDPVRAVCGGAGGRAGRDRRQLL